jgi:hypothetical protein
VRGFEVRVSRAFRQSAPKFTFQSYITPKSRFLTVFLFAGVKRPLGMAPSDISPAALSFPPCTALNSGLLYCFVEVRASPEEGCNDVALRRCEMSAHRFSRAGTAGASRDLNLYSRSQRDA